MVFIQDSTARVNSKIASARHHDCVNSVMSGMMLIKHSTVVVFCFVVLHPQ